MSLIIMCITVSAMMGTAVKEVQDKEEQGRLLRRLDHQPVWAGQRIRNLSLFRGVMSSQSFNGLSLLCQKGGHRAHKCDLKAEVKVQISIGSRRCVKCLKQGHDTSECKGDSCRNCSDLHYLILGGEMRGSHIKYAQMPDVNYEDDNI